jgi:hypothetical protein
VSGIRSPHFFCNLHCFPDLNERPIIYTGTTLRSLLPIASILNQFRPEWKEPALYWLNWMNLATARLKEMALRSLRLAQPESVFRPDDISLFEFDGA